MRILALDTATETCGVALWEEGRVAADMRIHEGLTHTRVLMQAVHDLLAQTGLALSAVDGFAVSQGPGSFTGLRIGVGTVKGLAMATGKPMAGVSTLAVLAHQAPPGTAWVCPMIDARRGELYWSFYRRTKSGLAEVAPEKAGPPAQVEFAGNDGCLFIGSGARLYARALQERWPAAVRLPAPGLHAPDPGVLARLGAERLRRGAIDDPRLFVPVYLRRSEAQVGPAPAGSKS